MKNRKLKYLITGTGRCGTVFMAQLFTLAGIPCGHESIFDWKGVTWAKKRIAGEVPLELSNISTIRMENGTWSPVPEWLPDVESIQAESSYMAAPFLAEPFLRDTKVIHVVRHPIRVIHSFCNSLEYFAHVHGTNSYEQNIYRRFPELKEDIPRYDRAALYYVRWNQMIQDHKPDLFVRLEDDLSLLFEFIGKDKVKPEDVRPNAWNKPIKYRFSSVTQIESDEVRKQLVEAGEKYGYQMSSEYLMI